MTFSTLLLSGTPLKESIIVRQSNLFTFNTLQHLIHYRTLPQRKEHYLAIRLFVVCALTFCGLIVRPFDSYCQGNVSYKINLPAIAKIESSNNPKAFNKLDHGGLGSRGLFQISDALRRDYNRLNKKSVSPSDLFNPAVNTSIAQWAFTSYFPSILKRLHKPVTVENLIVCQNAGCGALKRKHLPKITISYLKKYKELSQ